MSQCQAQGCCHGCCHAVDRRRFLHQVGVAAAAAGGLTPLSRAAADDKGEKVRVAAVFLRALLASDLEPVVRRLASEPPGGSGGQ